MATVFPRCIPSQQQIALLRSERALPMASKVAGARPWNDEARELLVLARSLRRRAAYCVPAHDAQRLGARTYK